MLTATPEPELRPTRRGRARRAASQAVAADSIAATRIIFGVLVAFSALRFMAKGWVNELWLAPAHHLSYPGFEWVQPLPGSWMYLLPCATAAAGIAMALGWHHRVATVLFLVSFTWTELIDAALYLNHYWFLTLVGILMLVLPVHHHWSLDARAGRVQRSRVVPAFVLWALRAQVGVVYFFAGVAKLNSDWLFRAEPLQLWLSDRSDSAVIGPLLDAQVVAFAASWGAAAFDLTIVGWLLWRRSRLAAWMTLATFHAVTGVLFQIGVFPLVMTLMALIYFDPDWPRRLPRLFRPGAVARSQPVSSTAPPMTRSWTLALLACVAVVQLVLPLRHLAQPGNVRWNEDGYYLAWRVMLTEKAGLVDFQVTDSMTGHTWTVGPGAVLTDWQSAHAATRPDLIHATALLIEQELTAAGSGRLEIRANAWVSMNGRAAAPLMNPELDLLQFERGALPAGAVMAAPR